MGLTVSVAERMGLDEDTRRAAELGALLHDIGKIAVPDEIINKPGPLNDEEWAIMKTHTVEGERMLAQVGGLLADVGVVVRASHERWDGGGYPDGLAGEAIPQAACIVSACDAFNAMTTDRSYRKALPLSVAVGELRKHRAPSSARRSWTRSWTWCTSPRPLRPGPSPPGSSPWLLTPLPRLLRRFRRRARPDPGPARRPGRRNPRHGSWSDRAPDAARSRLRGSLSSRRCHHRCVVATEQNAPGRRLRASKAHQPGEPGPASRPVRAALACTCIRALLICSLGGPQEGP